MDEDEVFVCGFFAFFEELEGFEDAFHAGVAARKHRPYLLEAVLADEGKHLVDVFGMGDHIDVYDEGGFV